jgi:hypothetical protein
MPAVLAESLPPFARPNGALLRAGTLRYALTLRKPDGQVVPLGSRLVTVGDTVLGGVPGWMIAEARTGTVLETTDSVYLARGDLTPERWISTIGRAQMAASITRDSMFGAVQSYQGRASFALALPAGALLSAGMVERMIELLPLQIGYRASATLILVEGASPRAVPAEILVERDERIDVGGLATDCWLVALRAGALEERLWVTKEGARVVRVEQAMADGVSIATLAP